MEFDILCFSTTDWDEIWGSRQQVMLCLAAKGYRVLFVERQVGPEQLLRDPNMRARKLAAWRQPRLYQVKTNLWRWQPPMMIPGRYFSRRMNHFGQSRLTAQIKPVLRQLGFKRPILWLYPPHSAPLIGCFNEKLVVYHCIERFSGEQAGRKRLIMEVQENELLRKADLVFTHSEGLRRLYAHLTRQPIILIPSAADVAHFQSTIEVHPAIAAIPHPHLVVMGTLDGRIDLQLLERIVQERPDWHLVLIGQIRSERANFNPLLCYPNVHSLGRQPFQQLPALLNGADVTLIPYILTGMTRYISPLKVYEYLATGKPVVSVDLPEVQQLSEWVFIVKEITGDPQRYATTFIKAIDSAMCCETVELHARRRQVAQQHSWDNRVETMLQAIAAIRMYPSAGNRVDWLVSQLRIVGGAETFLRETAPRMREAGWDLRVICLVSGGMLIDELRQEGVPVIELGVQNKIDLGVIFRLMKLWQTDRPALVHTHLYHAGILGRIAARLMGISPVVVHQQGPERARSRFRTWLDRATSPWVTCYTPSCQAVAQILQNREDVPARKIKVIYNGISLLSETAAIQPQDWPVPSGAIGLVCVGRLSPEKGQATLLEALASLKSQNYPLHTTFMGDGPLHNQLEEYSLQLGLTNQVTFVGIRRDIRNWLPNFDIFILPSDWEGISLALLESMATCLPTIATAVGGTPEVVLDGETGLLVPAGNPDALAKAISKLLNNPELRARMGQAGRRRIEERFSIEHTIGNLTQLYDQLLAEVGTA